jgi:hypothetical protein
MNSDSRVHWDAVINDGQMTHPNSDPSFCERSTLSVVLDLMPFEYEQAVLIQARDPKRRAPVPGRILVSGESEQREVHVFLKSREGKILSSLLKELSTWLRSKAGRSSTSTAWSI